MCIKSMKKYNIKPKPEVMTRQEAIEQQKANEIDWIEELIGEFKEEFDGFVSDLYEPQIELMARQCDFLRERLANTDLITVESVRD